ncbi:hypothetical protein [Burkholderia sp. BCC0322]|uniref:hypothetical protein n=1 Tax=unclassified Burkholderia TaxID=2613784 RepID=UPI00158C9FB7|nr:hypothetical protein [Burkholderia sp. BCC0322]
MTGGCAQTSGTRDGQEQACDLAGWTVTDRGSFKKVRTMIFRSLFRSSSSKQAAELSNDPAHGAVNCKRFDHPEFQIQDSDQTIRVMDPGGGIRLAPGSYLEALNTLRLQRVDK